MRARSGIPFLVVVLTPLFVATGCARPGPYRASTPGPLDAVYRCLLRQAEALGYVVVTADRAEGVARVERRTRPSGILGWLSYDYVDILDLTVEPTGDGTAMAVEVGRERRRITPDAQRNFASLTEAVKQDARRLLRRCTVRGAD